MSFSFSIKNEAGEDILEKYDINHQALGLAPHDTWNGGEFIRLYDLRNVLCTEGDFGQKYSLHVFKKATLIVSKNTSIKSRGLHSGLCSTCTCKNDWTPYGFEIEMAERFVNIPEDEIYSLEGGY